MKKTSFLVLGTLLIMIFISGCSNKNSNSLTFKGESEDWTAEYKVDNIDISINKDGNNVYTADKTLTVTYKNDLTDLSKVKMWEISYEVDRLSRSGAQSETRNDNGSPISNKTFVISIGGSIPDYIIEDKDDVIKVSVNIDGKVQNLELKSE